MSALIRFFSRRKGKDRTDGSEQLFLNDGHSPLHDKLGKLKAHKNEIECKVIHLDGQEITTYLPKKATGRQLYDRVFTNFDFTQEFDYFGLQYMDKSNVAQWLDPTKKIRKQLSIGPPYTLHLKVRFFSSEPQSLRDELTRYLFVMHLKEDIVSGHLKCDEELGAELAALCLQSELGDFDEEQHTLAFISQFRFMPEKMQTEDFEKATLGHFSDLAGRNMTPAAADKAYLDKARYLPDYGVDMHVVKGKDGANYNLGLTPTGILVYDNNQKIGFFFWPWIIKIGFNKSKLKIIIAEKDDETGVTHDHSFVFSLVDPRTCKHLWKCCVECHSFFRLTCNNQAPTKGSGKMLRMQSRFYSSYRTEFEMRHANIGSSHRRSARFQRVPSRRFSSRASFEKVEALGRKDGPKSKAERRAELKADTLRRIQEGDPAASPTPAAAAAAAAVAPQASPGPAGATASGDEAATIPRESLGSSNSSASRTHHTVVSIEAKVEPPPVPSRGTSSSSAPVHLPRAATTSTSSSSSDSEEEEAKPEVPLVARAAPETGPALVNSVFEETRPRMSSNIPKSIAGPARTAVGSASMRSAFKPKRLQEESTDEEDSPILNRSTSATAATATASPPQVSTSSSAEPAPSQIPRQTSISSLPRPRGPPPAPPTGSRIPKIAGPPPVSVVPSSPPMSAAQASSPPPISAAVVASSPQPISAVQASSPQPISAVQASSPPPTGAASQIPQPRRPSAAKPTGSRIPALVVAQPLPATTPRRSASSASSTSSTSSTSSASSPAPPKENAEKQEPKEEKMEEKMEEKKEEKEKGKETPPPTRIPSLPRPSRSEVKTQFQVETSFAAAVSTSHKLLPGHIRPLTTARAQPNVVLVKRAPGAQPGLCRAQAGPEQLSSTV